MVGKLQSIFQEKDYQNRDLVEDVVIELKQAYNTVNIYSDILTGIHGRICFHHIQ